MRSVDIQEAKTHLSRLLEEAARGEEIVIAKAGRPYVRLVPCTAETSPRPLGGWQGRVEIADDFDQTPSEVIDLFEGNAPREPAPKRKPTPSARKPKRPPRAR